MAIRRCIPMSTIETIPWDTVRTGIAIGREDNARALLEPADDRPYRIHIEVVAGRTTELLVLYVGVDPTEEDGGPDIPAATMALGVILGFPDGARLGFGLGAREGSLTDVTLLVTA
jgi:hypothetical protein